MGASDFENSSQISVRGLNGSTILPLSTDLIRELRACFGVSESRPLYIEISLREDVVSLRLRQGAAYMEYVWRLIWWSIQDGETCRMYGKALEGPPGASETPFILTSRSSSVGEDSLTGGGREGIRHPGSRGEPSVGQRPRAPAL